MSVSKITKEAHLRFGDSRVDKFRSAYKSWLHKIGFLIATRKQNPFARQINGKRQKQVRGIIGCKFKMIESNIQTYEHHYVQFAHSNSFSNRDFQVYG